MGYRARLDLLEHVGSRRHVAIRKELLAEGKVDVVRPGSAHTQIPEHMPHTSMTESALALVSIEMAGAVMLLRGIHEGVPADWSGGVSASGSGQSALGWPMTDHVKGDSRDRIPLQRVSLDAAAQRSAACTSTPEPTE